jgi:nucleoside-diphosphate-sugar epimerase
MDLNGVQGVEADLLDHHSLHEAVEGADTIYSMASPRPDEDEDFRINVEGVVNLLEVARESQVKTIVHLSTLDVYGFGAGSVSDSSEPKPGGRYQISKLQADRTFLEFAKHEQEPRVTIIRPARAFGSRDPTLTTPLLRMIESAKVVVPNSRTMSVSHPRDIAQAMFLAATKSVPTGRVYLVKSFDASASELARGIADSLGKPVELKGQSLLSKGGLPRYSSEQLRASVFLEPQSSWTELGYSPQYDLQKACDEVAAWYRKEPWALENL